MYILNTRDPALTEELSRLLARMPEPLHAPLILEPDGFADHATSWPPSARWTADRGAVSSEPRYFLDMDPGSLPESAPIRIVSEDEAGGSVYDLRLHLPGLQVSVSLGHYGEVETAAQAGEWILDQLWLRLPHLLAEPEAALA